MMKLALLLPLLAIGAVPRAGFKLEALLEADTLLFAEIVSAKDFHAAFKKTPLSKLFEDEEIRSFASDAFDSAITGFDELAKEFEKETGVPFERAWELADAQIALAMPTLTRGDPEQPDLVLTLDCTGKREALRKVVAIVRRAYEKHSGEKADIWKVGEDEIVSGELTTDVPLHLTILGDTLVATTWKGTMVDVVTSFRKGQPAPLSKAPNYLKARQKAAAKELFLYADVAGFVKEAKEKLGEMERKWVKALGLEGFTYAAGGLAIEEGMVREQFFFATSGQKKGLAKFLSLKGAAPGFAAAPAEALQFMSFSIDASDFYDTLLEMVKNADAFQHQRLLEQIAQFERDAGFSIRNDLLPAIGPHVSSYSALPREGLFPDAVTTFELRDPARFERCLQALRRNMGARIDSLEFMGKKIEYFAFEEPGGFEFIRLTLSGIYWIRDGKKLLVSGGSLGVGGSGGPNALKRHLLRQGKPTLATIAPIRSWLKSETAGASMVLYVDLGRIFAHFYNTGAPFLPYFRNVVRGLGVEVDLLNLPLGETIGGYLGQAVHRVHVEPDGLRVIGASASGTTLTTATFTGAATIVLLPAILKASEEAKTSACMTHCTSVFFGIMAYRGQKQSYPKKTGQEFVKELIDLGYVDEEPVCPHARTAPYRGPLKDVNTMGPSDVIFCDEPGNHPDKSINVLRKNGRMERLLPQHPDYRKALETTKGN